MNTKTSHSPIPSEPQITEKESFFSKLGLFKKQKTESASLKETVDAFFEDNHSNMEAKNAKQEKLLLTNVLHLQDMHVVDVMIPRADVFAIDIDTPQDELLEIFTKKQFSRYPIYKDSLDTVLGTVHIKEILACLAKGQKLDLKALMRDVPITSPAMTVPDLMALMQVKRKHMVLVVDEHGGIDGLVTIGDITEAVLGDIHDEYDIEARPVIEKKGTDLYLVDARVPLEELEEALSSTLLEEEDEDIDTVGGFVVYCAGRVPVRGEIIAHKETNTEFEILDADPRRLKKISVSKTKQSKKALSQ